MSQHIKETEENIGVIMKEFIKMSLEVFTQIGPYLIVFAILGYLKKFEKKEQINGIKRKRKE